MTLRTNMTSRKEDEQEMSMEEILASIRKYVTEDEENTSSPPLPKASLPEVSYKGEEILDLKHIHPADHLGHQSSSPQEPPANDRPSPVSKDFSSPQVVEAPIAAHADHPPIAPQSIENEKYVPQSSLASPATISASTQSLAKLIESTKAVQRQAILKDAVPAASPQTLESVAIQVMAPYLNNWLDTHLPILVERLVQKEIERVTQELLKK